MQDADDMYRFHTPKELHLSSWESGMTVVYNPVT